MSDVTDMRDSVLEGIVLVSVWHSSSSLLATIVGCCWTAVIVAQLVLPLVLPPLGEQLCVVCAPPQAPSSGLLPRYKDSGHAISLKSIFMHKVKNSY